MTTLTPPKQCESMQALRAEIDALDRDLVEMLATRAGYIDRAIELKQINGWPARIPNRVEDVVRKVRQTASERGLDPDLTETLWRELIDWSITREAKVIQAD
ncbi:chorismate mutase [uncultured Shimia sp.]|uniref:chorismate mutase n=1 Tax=uncultured Shimia sp. TaxID=573152 RepID=UPI002621C486|nr:chorismate mutase [uncultured Shimia sp.]